MKIFLDTANIEEIRKAMELGVIDGVTTNPTLVSRENAIFEERIVEICELVKGPVSAEAVSTKYKEMVEEAGRLAQLSEHVVVKIPMTPDGIRAVRELKTLGVKTNVTLVFSPLQSILAAKAGGTYVSPFIGRLDDIGHMGMELVEQIVQIYRNYDFETKIIVASIRHPEHVIEAAMIGADIVTVPFAVLEKMFKHPLTDIGLVNFQKDWERYLEYLKNKKG